MAGPPTKAQWQRAVVVLSNTVAAMAIICALYLGQSVFKPIAISLLLTFLLSPLVTRVEQLRIGRVASVMFVVAAVGIAFGTLIWFVSGQVSGLAAELPQYTQNIRNRIHNVREITGGQTLDALGWMLSDISEEWTASAPDALPVVDSVTPIPESATVVVQSAEPDWLQGAPQLASEALAGLVSLGLALVLTIFTLVRRESLRNRIIWLAGDGGMSATTKAVDETGERISRYLLAQFFLNVSYGAIWGIGLYAIGVAYAPLWAVLAAVLRYIPYLGATIAAVIPIVLSVAQFPGWSQPLTVVALLITLELLSNNFVEPMVYGRSIGVSEVALIVSAAFWALLWGPVGLVLSAPLTVCLIVLGRHVSRFQTLVVLMGDEPALANSQSFYQRLLAQDHDEAEELFLAEMKSAPFGILDNLFIPALNSLKRDRAGNTVSDEEEKIILRAIREMLEDVPQHGGPATVLANGDLPPRSPVQLIACPAHDDMDRVALEMLRLTLDPLQWDVDIVGGEALASELVARNLTVGPALICISALPPAGVAHTRYLCKRIKSLSPDIRILVGRWGPKTGMAGVQEQLREAGADHVATTLAETQHQLQSWLPILVDAGARGAAAKLG